MPKETQDQPERVRVKLTWVGLEAEPVQASNHFISQFDDSLFYLSFGLATPPVLLGSPDERKRQAEQLEVVPIETVARLALTPQAMGQLIGVLQTNLKAAEELYHRIQEEGEDNGDD